VFIPLWSPSKEGAASNPFVEEYVNGSMDRFPYPPRDSASSLSAKVLLPASESSLMY
jgi:hypothetical protein